MSNSNMGLVWAGPSYSLQSAHVPSRINGSQELQKTRKESCSNTVDLETRYQEKQGSYSESEKYKYLNHRKLLNNYYTITTIVERICDDSAAFLNDKLPHFDSPLKNPNYSTEGNTALSKFEAFLSNKTNEGDRK